MTASTAELRGSRQPHFIRKTHPVEEELRQKVWLVTEPAEAWGRHSQGSPGRRSRCRGEVHLAALDEPPLRFRAGADAVVTFGNRAKLLFEQADAHRDLSSNLSHDDA
jgi:hypothetical protein